MPSTLRKANTTFVNLRATLDDLDRLVAESKPATRELAPFLRELRPLVNEAGPTMADLRRLIRAPGANNDLIDLTAKQPRLAQLTSTVFPRAIRALDRAQPVFEYVRGYTPDLTSWISNFGQAGRPATTPTATTPASSPCSLTATFAGETLTAADPAEKLSGFDTGVLTPLPGRHRSAAAGRLCSGAAGRVRSIHDPARPVRRLVLIALFVAIAPWLVIGIVREAGDDDTSGRYLVRAVFDNASNSSRART